MLHHIPFFFVYATNDKSVPERVELRSSIIQNSPKVLVDVWCAKYMAVIVTVLLDPADM